MIKIKCDFEVPIQDTRRMEHVLLNAIIRYPEGDEYVCIPRKDAVLMKRLFQAINTVAAKSTYGTDKIKGMFMVLPEALVHAETNLIEQYYNEINGLEFI